MTDARTRPAQIARASIAWLGTTWKPVPDLATNVLYYGGNPRSIQRPRRLLPTALFVGAVLGGCASGFEASPFDSTSGVHIETGEAHSKGDGGGSIITDRWTYGFPNDIAWTDLNDGWHEGGLPDCLPPLSTVDGVRFAWIEVSIEGTGWRPVLWIDCRSVPSP